MIEKGWGEAIARNIENALNLYPLWLDQENAAEQINHIKDSPAQTYLTMNADDKEMMSLMEGLTKKQKQKIIEEIKKQARENQEIREELDFKIYNHR